MKDITTQKSVGMNDQAAEAKKYAIEALKDVINGTVDNDGAVVSNGFSVTVQIGKVNESDNIKILMAIFVVRHDGFDEPLIEPVDAQGTTLEEAASMAVNIFNGGAWHALNQSVLEKDPIYIPVDFLGQHYDFDMYSQAVVRIGVKDKEPTMLLNFIQDEIPKYLGSKKYYWLRVYLAKFQDKKIIEIRMNGSVCVDLPKYFEEYVEKEMDASKGFVSEEQYAIFVQREDDKCPFKRELVMNAAKKTIEMMTEITNAEEYQALMYKIEELVEGNKGLAAELRILIPEIFAKLLLGYREGDSLFLIDNKSEGQQQTEFKKTQLRSYFYMQQAILEYLNEQPPQEKVHRIVVNSVAFREFQRLRKAAQEAGKELEPQDLHVPGTSYKIGYEGYRVW